MKGIIAALTVIAVTGFTLIGCSSGSSDNTQQYYNQGYTYAQGFASSTVITSAVQNGNTTQVACQTIGGPDVDSGAGVAGTAAPDTGPTSADQTAWVNGCVAGYSAANGG
jgi:hypothetical protein